MLGYAVVLASVAQAAWLAASNKPSALVASGLVLIVFALLQATLGVWTLLLAVPIPLGLAHQAGAVAVFAAAVHHLWRTTREPGASEAQAAASA
jgi:cytochrome c oxidase assembly protein subunit 15